MFSTQRKTLLGLDLQYQLNKNLNIGGNVAALFRKALIEKVNIGDETVNNSMRPELWPITESSCG